MSSTRITVVGKMKDGISGVLDKIKKRVADTSVALKKTAPDIDRTTTAFRDMGGAGESVGAVLDGLKTLMMGPFGAAIAAVVVALGAMVLAYKAVTAAIDITSRAVKAYIGGNRKAKKANDQLGDSFDKLVRTFGRAVVGGEAVVRIMAHVRLALDELSQWIERHAPQIFGFFKALAANMLRAVGVIAATAMNLVIGVTAPIEAIFEGFQKLGSGLVIIARDIASNAQKILKALPGDAAAKMAAQMTDVVIAADQAVAKFEARTAFGITRGLSNTSLSLQRKIKGQIEFIESLAFEGGKLGPGAKALGAGGGANDKDKPDRSKFFRNLKGLGGDLDSNNAAGQEFASAAQGTADQMRPVIAQWQRVLNKLKSVNPALEVTNNYLKEQAATLRDQVAGAWATTFSVIGEGLGTLVAGEATLGQFFGNVVKGFAGIWDTIGEGYIQAGIGMNFLPGGQGGGAGLILAGVGLKALSGFQSAMGSKLGGGGGGGGRGSGISSLERTLQRFLPDRERAGAQNLKVEVLLPGGSFDRAVRASVKRNMATGNLR